MKFKIIKLPAFKACISGVDKNFNFSEEGILGKFDKFFSNIVIDSRDDFRPRDYLYFDQEKEGLVWMFALVDYMDISEYEVIDFDGGLFVTYVYKDGDDEANSILYKEALEYIKNDENIELDIRKNHYPMGHIITPKVLYVKQGWGQMETFIPVKMIK